MPDGPALETAPTTQAETPLQAPDVSTTEATVEAGAAPETPVEGPQLPEGWNDHPEVKAKLAEHYQQGQSKGDRAFRRQVQEIEGHFEERSRQIEQSVSASRVVTDLGQALAELSDTAKIGNNTELLLGIQQLFTRNENWAQVLGQDLRNAGRGDFARDLSTKLYEGLEEDASEDLADVVSDLNAKLRRGQLKDADAFQKMLGERDKILRTSWEKEKEAEIEKKVLARLEAEGRAVQRNGNPPAVKVENAAGGGTGWRTKTEARNLHVAGKLTNTEMRRIRDDPSIPD